MMKKIIIPALISTALISFQVSGSDKQEETSADNPDTTKFEKVFVSGLQGNINAALTFLDTLNDAQLTPRQEDIKKKFYSRFRTKDEDYKYISTDENINRLIGIYTTYWRNALLDNASIERHDSELTENVVGFLKANYDIAAGKTDTDMQENFPQYLQDYLLSKGIYAATGKTGMFFDLLLHAKESEVIYKVTTPEDTIDVKVVFMEEIISNGWEDYATFGKFYPGGWATTDALYCVRESYDLESENFLVSYLKHEGKHFADYKQFPKLGGTDLEYRAKLVELSEAKKNVYSLIYFFSLNAKYDKQNPHGFANFCLVRNLSGKIFNEEMVTDIEKWKTISMDNINKAAGELLKQNTEELKKAGAETVTDYIK